MKLSKPKLRRSFAGGLWMCEGGYTTYSSCPVKAYQLWLAKEQVEPYHLYSERTMKEMFERIDKRKKENPELFEKRYYSKEGMYKPKEPENTVHKVGSLPNIHKVIGKIFDWFKGCWK